jgi:branched-chain amino acid transport system ATP-binding protein
VRLLETLGLSISFGRLRAVDQGDAHIDEGEILSLIGPNGAGKTTFFNLITGFLRPTKGRVIYLGQDLTGLQPHQIAAHRMVRTFQKTNIFSEVTVEERITIGFHMRRKCGIWQILLNGQETKEEGYEIQKQTSEILGLAGLGSWAKLKGKNHPYGKQRIFEVAVALAGSPRLLLLDEPATGLNPKATQELVELIRRIRGERGITVCPIEHNMNVVTGISNRKVVLNYGKKITEGTPEEISKDRAMIEAYLGRGYGDAQGKSN